MRFKAWVTEGIRPGVVACSHHMGRWKVAMTGAVATQAAVDRAELFRALGVLAEPPGPAQARLVDLLGLPRPTGVGWTEAFTVQLVPHAAIYLSPDGMLGGETAERVAGF